MLKQKQQCIHHWFINSEEVGTCQKCGATKNFGNLMAKFYQHNLPAHFRGGEASAKRRKTEKEVS